MSVEDEEGRERALGEMVRRIDGGFYRDEVDLRDWIDSAEVDRAAKDRLVEILEEASR